MNKVETFKEILKLAERNDFSISYGASEYYFKVEYDRDTLFYKVIEIGKYHDTGGGWIKFYSKDFYKEYQLNPVEILLIDKFCW